MRYKLRNVRLLIITYNKMHDKFLTILRFYQVVIFINL